METQLFDRETILDLVVNFIPLGIILFFVAMFVVVTPWGFDSRETTIMLALMIVPFLGLLVLTYLSAVAIAGDEKRAPVYSQGQAGLEGAKTRHEQEAEIDAEETAAETPDAESTPDAEGDDGDDERDPDAEETTDDTEETVDDNTEERVDDDTDETVDDDTEDAADGAEDATDDDTKPDEH